eukprot:g3868.t1
MPHVLLTDLQLPDGSGMELIRDVRTRCKLVEIMVISILGDEQSVISAVLLGANGYLLKDAFPPDIANTVRELMKGHSPMASSDCSGLMAIALPVIRTRRTWLPVYLGGQIAVALLCLLVLRWDLPRPPVTYLINSAEVAEGDAWLPITFPDYRRAHLGFPPPVDYRMSFRVPDLRPDEPWSVFIPRFTAGVQVFVNGDLVADTLREKALSRPDRNVAAVALIPPSLLLPGTNAMTVRLSVWGPIPAYLDSVYVGPDRELRASYDARLIMFETFPLVLMSLQATLALVFALIWVNRRQDLIYGILSAAMGIGVVQSFIPMPAPLPLQGFIAAAVSLESALMVVVTALLVQLRLPRASWLLFLPGLAILLLGTFGSRELLQRGYLVLGPPSITLSVVLISITLGWSAVTRKDKASILLGTAFTVVMVTCLHDLLTVVGVFGGERLFIGRISYSLVLVTISLGLTWRFVQALNDADGFSHTLIRQVNDAEKKLRESFVREEKQARAEALAAERTRLMRDLHDGLGGQLVSIVALAEQGHNAAAMGEAARAALKDLRLVIDAMDEIDGDFMLVLGSWRERVSAQLRAHGIALSWQVLTPGGLPIIAGLRPWHVIQIIRLLDEAVTNAVKHADTDAIVISIDTVTEEGGSECGRITIRDHGKGFGLPVAPIPRSSGRGIANMSRRADLCGAQFHIDSDERGTTVVLVLPAAMAETP